MNKEVIKATSLDNVKRGNLGFHDIVNEMRRLSDYLESESVVNGGRVGVPGMYYFHHAQSLRVFADMIEYVANKNSAR